MIYLVLIFEGSEGRVFVKGAVLLWGLLRCFGAVQLEKWFVS